MSDVMDEGYWCERVFRDHQLSVVRLHTAADNDFRGNGFIVSRNASKTICDIVSCQHVVNPLPEGGIMTVYFFNSDGMISPPYNARIVHTDEGRDLAWLRAEAVLEPVTCLRFFDPPYASGWNVIALAFTTLGGSSATILEPGTFSGQITNEPGQGYLTCSCSSKQGASGAPLILPGEDREDSVVGVLTGASHASVDAIPVTAIREFLLEWIGGEGMDNMSIAGLVVLGSMMVKVE